MLTRAALALPVLIAAAPAQSLELDMPLACRIGQTCWVQQYADRDPGKTAKDYACGGEAYDGHDGTDIRIRDTATRGIAVIAAAAGTVRAVRGDMPDRLVRSEADSQRIKNKECGNGVIIDHGDGWQTQYCHMRANSLTVAAGDRVERGAKLGEVGYSGMAAFPHVHLTVRKDGQPVDPFRMDADPTSCGEMSGSLWSAEAQKTLAYRRGDIIAVGVAPGPIDMPALEEGKLTKQSPAQDWPALVGYVWSINLQKGDEIKVSLQGPAGTHAENTDRLDRNKAQYMLFAGSKQPAEGWAPGEYIIRATVARDGDIAIEKQVSIRIN